MQELIETIESHLHALGHAGLHGGQASFLGRVEDSHRGGGLAVLFGEHESIDCFRPVAAPGLDGDEAFRRTDFAIRAAHFHFRAVALAPDEVPRAALAKIYFTDWHGPAFRPEEPLRNIFGIGPSVEDECARGV